MRISLSLYFGEEKIIPTYEMNHVRLLGNKDYQVEPSVSPYSLVELHM